MIEVHIRALEQILRCKMNVKELKTVDHWNNQVANFRADNNFTPAVYFDFGQINWQRPMGDTYQTGKVNITAHCVSYNYRPTRDKAPDDDGGRLKRFDWSEKIMNTLNGTKGSDRQGNAIFSRLNLVGCQFDTNHAAVFDDLITFSTQINYFGWWYSKHWKEVLITGLDTTGEII